MKSYNFQIKVEQDTFNDENLLKHTVVSAKDPDWVQLCAKYRTMIGNEFNPKAESSSPGVEASEFPENLISNSPEKTSQSVNKKHSHPCSDKSLPSEPSGSLCSRDPRLRQKQSN